jgi:hypothetical protein
MTLMKALLSHSSKDKYFVRQIADALGMALTEYDEYTFEFVLNAQAIRKAFTKCNLFVLFLSANSIRSEFVGEEMRTALDFRAQGQLKKVLIIALDHTSFKTLPEWMQAINVVTILSTPKTCARRIEAELYALEAEQDKSTDIYIPREEEGSLRKMLSKPPGIAPVAIHAVGHAGIGKRTFIQKTLRSMFPRNIQTFVSVPLNRYEGVNELYRRLYDYFVVSSVDEKIVAFERFAQASEAAQIETLTDIFVLSIEYEELIVVEDGGGAYTDDGSYQPFLAGMIRNLRGANRPIVAFAQTRMMPLKLREELPESFHTFLHPLEDSKISELLSFSLRDAQSTFRNSSS